MPELPEVEVLVRHLAPLINGRTIRAVQVNRLRVVRPHSARQLRKALTGAVFNGLDRRGKYLLFQLQPKGSSTSLDLVGHLGMTGRMYLLPRHAPLPAHSAVVLDLGRDLFVFEDTRYFGRLTLSTNMLPGLGPEPLGPEFTGERFLKALNLSTQPIKVKLLDQSLVAGIGNIYASEALFRARISPKARADRIRAPRADQLRLAIQETLREAITFGSTVSLNYTSKATDSRDRLFYYGRNPGSTENYEERLLVYDREGLPCTVCCTRIRRVVQAARSTFYCPHCQRK